MLKNILIAYLFLVTSSASVSAEKVLNIGDLLASIELKNQHEKSIKVASDANTIVFAVEKAPSDLINSFLMKQAPDFLVNNKAYFIADISGMPSVITKMFAIPKMKKRPYDILLARDGALSEVSSIPRKKGLVTVLKISDGKVTAINFVDSADRLKEAFE